MAKISDFILLKKALEVICYDFDCDFIDCEVEFSLTSDTFDFYEGCIRCPADSVPEQTLAKTLYNILEVYLENLSSINGFSIPENDKRSILTYFFALVNTFTMKEGVKSDRDRSDKLFMKLNQHPIVWALMRDIFCPLHEVELKNIKIAAGHSHVVDAVICINKDNLDKDDIPNIFLNLDVESEAIRSAFLLYHAVQIHFIDEDPSSIIKSLFVDHFIKNTLVGFIKMMLEKEEDIYQFFACLSLLTQMEEIESYGRENDNSSLPKTAQVAIEGNWWFKGLIEKMLAPARGPDWSVTEGWKGVTQELWDKVEKERKRRGLVEVPFELLLRISSEHLKTKKDKTLQGLLGDARVW